MFVPLGLARGRSAWTVRTRDGRAYAVFVLADGRWRVTDALCPHREGPLEEGQVRGPDRVATTDTLTCPRHRYRFSLDTGACLTAPRYTLGVHPVVERDGEYFVEVDAPSS